MKIWKKDYYEKLLGVKSSDKTVQDYQLQIQQAQLKIFELQSRCTHDNYEVVFYSWRTGAMCPSHVCTGCDKYLRDATKEESAKLWEEYYGEEGEKAVCGIQTTTNIKISKND